jgi:hypothetical protein
MTVTELREALATLRWSHNDLADETGLPDTAVRRWISGADPVPRPIADALGLLVAYHRAHPVPSRKAGA